MVVPLWVCQSVSCNQHWRARQTDCSAIGPPTFFCHGQKGDYLSRATKNYRTISVSLVIIHLAHGLSRSATVVICGTQVIAKINYKGN